MLVIARRVGESVVVQEEVLVSVIGLEGGQALMRVARKGSRMSFDEIVEEKWVASRSLLKIDEGVLCHVVKIEPERVRLGFEGVAQEQLCRWEVFEKVRGYWEDA